MIRTLRNSITAYAKRHQHAQEAKLALHKPLDKSKMAPQTDDMRTKLGFDGASSEILEDTSLEAGQCPREFYLKNPLQCPPPFIAHSDFVPPAMVEHLMRNKKDSALGVKFWSNNQPPDQITNMEGALHTYVTPVVMAKIHGDYRFRGGHGMVRYANSEGFQRARRVVISAAVQPDFEDNHVMVALMRIRETEIVGKKLSDGFNILDTASKQDQSLRESYDKQIRMHLIACLTHDSRLPPLGEVKGSILDVQKCCELLEKLILSSEDHSSRSTRNVFVGLPYGEVISLEMLCNSAIHQARNELQALEQLCTQGYIYTSDPPSIFAQAIGAKVVNRAQILALKHLAMSEHIEHMKIFAFNDYADPKAIVLLEQALKPLKTRGMSKNQVFSGKGGAFEPPPEAEHAVLVIHNNSDGFGQNVETEGASGSLDGAIGYNSSAAASLRRDRKDLTDYRLSVQ